ncbi:ribose-phosphate diphosphokinase [Anaeromyxobacter terrae]|uniref:ribose-phosphate diphosphokinase n=1 Tax=Anaeromyxobacter terrae TaxID=2925406 RepID=UPI001F56F6CB|nr:ribose-phosphate pyrophosphokinase [Anaeromyxobacter sp. SG22]
MRAILVGGSYHPALTAAIAAELGLTPAARTLERFPDGELHVAVKEPLRGADVYLVQPLGPQPDAHLLELLFLADACRRAGAARVTAVVPYLAWARQDRRRADGEPLGARLAADLLSARADRVIAVDVHGAAAEGFFSVPLDHLTAIPALAAAIARVAPRDAVIVAPDLGAAKRAEAFGRLLALPSACVHKTRLSAREVAVRGVSGEVAGRAPIIVDDMISTGATIEAASRTLLAAGSRPELVVAATHALLVPGAAERLAALPLARLVVTDSLPVPETPGLATEVVPLAPLLAEAIRRLREERPLAELLATI